MIIDFHTHCFPDEIAANAVPALAKKSGIQPMSSGTVDGLKSSMQTNGITHSVVLSIATKPTQTEKINNWAAGTQRDNLFCFGSIHPLYENWKAELKRVRGLGLKGIKFHPEYQDFYVDDEAMFPIYDYAFEQGLVVLFHAGGDLGYIPPFHCTPERLELLVSRFKGGKIIAAHMGGFSYWDEVEKHLKGKDIYLDTSFAVGVMEDEQAKRMIRSHGYQRILFGSDSPWKDQGWSVQSLRGLQLSQEAEDAIFFKNAAGLLGII